MERALSHEQLIPEIADHIGRITAVETKRAECNAVVEGRTDSHPVDVYWEFTDGDITYKTVIKASAWDKAATNRELFSFVSLLRDIPGQTTGVYFTQPIYDKDTLKLARDAGVLLLELPGADGAPLKEPVIHNAGIQVDEEWVKAQKERLGIEDQTFQFSGDPKYLFLYDAEDNCIDSVHGVISDYIDRTRDGNTDKTTVRHFFENPVFLQVDNDLMPRVKLMGISFDLEYIDPLANVGEEIVQFILDYVLRYYSR